jgi:hypothetical protein
VLAGEKVPIVQGIRDIGQCPAVEIRECLLKKMPHMMCGSF